MSDNPYTKSLEAQLGRSLEGTTFEAMLDEIWAHERGILAELNALKIAMAFQVDVLEPQPEAGTKVFNRRGGTNG